MSKSQIIEEILRLTDEEKRSLIKEIEESLGILPAKKRSLTELAGLGKEIWEGVDPDEYVRKLRSEWR